MDVVGGVVAHRGKIEAFEQLELLQKYRALRPWPALEDRDAAIVRAGGRFESRREAREVGGGEQAAVGVGPCDDVARDVAAIEALARAVEASLASSILRRRFRIEHALEKICQRGILEHAPRQRNFAIGQIDAPRRRPLGKEALGVAAKRRARPGHRFVGEVGIAGQSYVHRKTIVGELRVQARAPRPATWCRNRAAQSRARRRRRGRRRPAARRRESARYPASENGRSSRARAPSYCR